MRVRLYVLEAEIGKKITLTKEQVRHLKVLRLTEGAKIRVFDGKGREFEAVCSGKVSEGHIAIEREVKGRKEPNLKITLAIAVPKGNRMDFLVEKVSELGVINIVPMICSRSVVKPSEMKVERWKKIAIEACCQSDRNIVPMVSKPIAFGELLPTIKNYNHAFLCHPTGQLLAEEYCECQSALIIVGPEGDFTQAEMDAAEEAGCTLVSLGPTILRVETAGITAVAQLISLSQKSL
ncbi:MAG TPA: RsmE family RNA methyltransferase [Candidatus Nanoarchaeia archaeon]|nr:RsmE family RNA methyltransferase [Candidatus Nanoarchaeia archaeon]